MSFSRTSNNLALNFLDWLSTISFSGNKSKPQPKIHDYSHSVDGSDYILESLPESLKVCMTGFGKGIKPNDYIMLQKGCESDYYQVEEINYYADPSDMWIALLHQCKHTAGGIRHKA